MLLGSTLRPLPSLCSAVSSTSSGRPSLASAISSCTYCTRCGPARIWWYFCLVSAPFLVREPLGRLIDPPPLKSPIGEAHADTGAPVPTAAPELALAALAALRLRVRAAFSPRVKPRAGWGVGA